MFQIGNRVEHIQHEDRRGSIGTVVGGHGSRTSVVWDKDSSMSKYFISVDMIASAKDSIDHGTVYLKLAQEFMKYDPTQQGDNDDDI